MSMAVSELSAVGALSREPAAQLKRYLSMKSYIQYLQMRIEMVQLTRNKPSRKEPSK